MEADAAATDSGAARMLPTRTLAIVKPDAAAHADEILHIAELKAAMAREGAKEVTFEPGKLAQNNRQGRKLMQMITVAVRGLNNVPALIPAVQELGRRHVGYGVRDEDYATVGSALLWTLEKGLGPAFTPEVKDAWATVYGVLATTMRDAANSMPGSPA